MTLSLTAMPVFASDEIVNTDVTAGPLSIAPGTIGPLSAVPLTGLVQTSNSPSERIIKNIYSIDYSIINALFLNKDNMQFNVNLSNNVKVSTIKVIAKDQDNNDLQINANASADTKSLLYTVNLNINTTKISIFVYPLTADMVKNKKLDINTIPFKTSTLTYCTLYTYNLRNRHLTQ